MADYFLQSELVKKLLKYNVTYTLCLALLNLYNKTGIQDYSESLGYFVVVDCFGFAVVSFCKIRTPLLCDLLEGRNYWCILSMKSVDM